MISIVGWNVEAGVEESTNTAPVDGSMLIRPVAVSPRIENVYGPTPPLTEYAKPEAALPVDVVMVSEPPLFVIASIQIA